MKIVFYRAEHVAALKRKNRIWTAICVLIWALTLAALLCFVLKRNTLNAKRMEFLATAALAIGGWIAIAVRDCAVRYLRAQREHEERILASAEPVREERGRVTLEKKSVPIARSIDVRGVRIQTPERPVRLLVSAAFARALEKEAAQGDLTVRAVEGYVTEVER